MAITLQTAAQYIPFFRYKNISTTTWGSTPNSAVIADSSVSANSVIIAYPTGTAPAGRWYLVSQTAGTGFTLGSSDPENSTQAITYIVL